MRRRQAKSAAPDAASGDESFTVSDDESEHSSTCQLPPQPSSSPCNWLWLIGLAVIVVGVGWYYFPSTQTQPFSCDQRIRRDTLPLTLQAFLNPSLSGPLAFSMEGTCPCLAAGIACGYLPIIFPKTGESLHELLLRAKEVAFHTPLLIGGISGRTRLSWFEHSLKQCIDPVVAFSSGVSCDKFGFLFEDAPLDFYPGLIAPLDASRVY